MKINVSQSKINEILLKQCYKGNIYILKFRLKKEMRSKVNNHLPC